MIMNGGMPASGGGGHMGQMGGQMGMNPMVMGRMPMGPEQVGRSTNTALINVYALFFITLSLLFLFSI